MSFPRHIQLLVPSLYDFNWYKSSRADQGGSLHDEVRALCIAPASTQNTFRPYSNFGSLTYWSHGGDSNYHSLQTLFRTKIGQFQLQAAYTWSHAIADVVTDDSSGGTGAQSFTYFQSPTLDKGNSATNRPNIFIANSTYFLPKLRNRSALVQQTLGGWELRGITSANSGNSFTVFQNGFSGGGTASSLVYTGLTSNQRPLSAANQACSQSNLIKGEQIINPSSFTLVGYHLGTLEPGMARRGSCSGPKLVNTDFSIDKNWIVKERVTIQLRIDAFDLFNHANFRADQSNMTNPIASISCANGSLTTCSTTNNVVTSETRSANFGKATSIVGNAGRQLQYQLHIQF